MYECGSTKVDLLGAFAAGVVRTAALEASDSLLDSGGGFWIIGMFGRGWKVLGVDLGSDNALGDWGDLDKGAACSLSPCGLSVVLSTWTGLGVGVGTLLGFCTGGTLDGNSVSQRGC